MLTKRRTIWAFVATAFAQGSAVLGGVALAATLGRIGGPQALGSFTVMLSLLGALGMLARRGQTPLVTRSAAWAMNQGGRSSAPPLLALGIRRVLLPSLAVGTFGALLLWSGVLGTPYPGSIIAFPVALLFLTVLAVFGGYARGTGRPWLAPLFELRGVSSVTVIVLIAVLSFWGRPSAEVIMAVFVIAMILLAGFAAVFVRRDATAPIRSLSATHKQREEMRRGQIPFTIIALGSFLIQSGSFVLAAPFLSEESIGLLRAAERLALLVTFPVLAINSVIVSRVVPAARNGDHHRLYRLVGGAMLAAAGLGLPVMFALLIAPERALALMGTEFGAAARYLKIMALVQFFAATLAPLMILLNMSGRERTSMWINLGTLILAVILFPTLCATFGGVGFVIAYSGIIVARYCLIGAAVAFAKNQSQLVWP